MIDFDRMAQMNRDICAANYEIVKLSSEFRYNSFNELRHNLDVTDHEYVLMVHASGNSTAHPYYFDHYPTTKEVTDAILKELYCDDTYVTEQIMEYFHFREWPSEKWLRRKAVPKLRKLSVILRKRELTKYEIVKKKGNTDFFDGKLLNLIIDSCDNEPEIGGYMLLASNDYDFAYEGSHCPAISKNGFSDDLRSELIDMWWDCYYGSAYDKGVVGIPGFYTAKELENENKCGKRAKEWANKILKNYIIIRIKS